MQSINFFHLSAPGVKNPLNQCRGNQRKITAMKSLRVLVSGQVHGVWYRGWAAERANALHLAGWVRNLADGRVEALFHGPEPAVAAMVAACRVGPPAARVETVDAEEWRPPVTTGFHRRPTATFPDDRG